MTYPTTVIGTKNQVVIPSKIRHLVEGVKPGARVIFLPLSPHSIQLNIVPKDWIKTTKGKYKNWWGKDSTAYLKKLRQSWL